MRSRPASTGTWWCCGASGSSPGSRTDHPGGSRLPFSPAGFSTPHWTPLQQLAAPCRPQGATSDFTLSLLHLDQLEIWSPSGSHPRDYFEIRQPSLLGSRVRSPTDRPQSGAATFRISRRCTNQAPERLQPRSNHPPAVQPSSANHLGQLQTNKNRPQSNNRSLLDAMHCPPGRAEPSSTMSWDCRQWLNVLTHPPPSPVVSPRATPSLDHTPRHHAHRRP